MSCRHTTEQITEYRDGTLPFWTALRMRFHLRLCPGCGEFSRQIESTKDVVKTIPSEPPPASVRDHLLDEFRKKT